MNNALDNQPAIDGPYAETGELAKQFGATDAEAEQMQTRVDFLAGGLRAVTQSHEFEAWADSMGLDELSDECKWARRAWQAARHAV